MHEFLTIWALIHEGHCRVWFQTPLEDSQGGSYHLRCSLLRDTNEKPNLTGIQIASSHVLQIAQFSLRNSKFENVSPFQTQILVRITSVGNSLLKVAQWRLMDATCRCETWYQLEMKATALLIFLPRRHRSHRSAPGSSTLVTRVAQVEYLVCRPWSFGHRVSLPRSFVRINPRRLRPSTTALKVQLWSFLRGG